MHDQNTDPSLNADIAPSAGGADKLAPVASASLPASGRRQAFRDIRRQLTDDDLTSAGVQKLILDELEKAEGECEQMQAYVERFHEADKRAAVLEEKIRPARSIEIFFGVGVGLGGATLGLAPYFADRPLHGVLCAILGGALIFGSVFGRMVKG